MISSEVPCLNVASSSPVSFSVYDTLRAYYKLGSLEENGRVQIATKLVRSDDCGLADLIAAFSKAPSQRRVTGEEEGCQMSKSFCPGRPS